MKEATGELNMTVVTLVAIAAVGALFYFVIWPTIQQMVMNQTCSAYGDFHSVKADGHCTNITSTGNAKTRCYACCPKNVTQYNDNVGCFVAE